MSFLSAMHPESGNVESRPQFSGKRRSSQAERRTDCQSFCTQTGSCFYQTVLRRWEIVYESIWILLPGAEFSISDCCFFLSFWAEGAVAVAEFIAESPRLIRLDLRENEIKTGGLMALSLALKVNTSLLRLDLDREPKKETVSTTPF